MAWGLLANIAGFSLSGLAVRFGQLGLQRRHLWENPWGHVASMTVWGFAGYWAYQWDLVAPHIIEEKRTRIAEKQQARLAGREEALALAHAAKEAAAEASA